jgi:hypothetical protein
MARWVRHRGRDLATVNRTVEDKVTAELSVLDVGLGN